MSVEAPLESPPSPAKAWAAELRLAEKQRRQVLAQCPSLPLDATVYLVGRGAMRVRVTEEGEPQIDLDGHSYEVDTDRLLHFCRFVLETFGRPEA